jgi:hypothetical protein
MKTMPTTTNAKASSATAPYRVLPVMDSWFIPPMTMESRLVRIQALGQRIAEHVQFIGAVGELAGTSEEAKQKTVALFYERLLVMEQELARIHENLQLE